MTERHLRVLLIDDDEEDYLITRDILADIERGHGGVGGASYEVRWCASYDEGLAELPRGAHDVCLLDYRLGGGRTGLDLLREAEGARRAAPIIMLTGVGDQEVDLAAMQAGAADYLIKGRIDAQLLERSIRYAIERKRSEAELARKNEELVRLNDEKSRFVGIAAHDLRSPLGIILGYSDLLLRMYSKVMPKGELDIVERIRSSSQSMLHLINDLLDISTIEAGQLNLDRQRVDLAELARGAVDLYQIVAAQKRMELRFSADEGGTRAWLDARKAEQVLNNLLSNAVQYSFPESAIDVSVRRAGGEVVVAVRDRGPGIAKEDLGNLFKPFGRARTVSTGGEKSTGLGLAIARRIVEGHGGRIWVESELGEGAMFAAAFPAE
jgi:two-component system sensor histidine kinase/response regulator